MTGKAQSLPTTTDEGPASEAELARRFSELYDQQFDFIWRSVRMLGVTEHAVDDVVQDVFLVAHRRLGDFEGRSAPRTWLFAIAVRVVSDHRRSQRRRMRLLERAESMDRPRAPTPLDAAAHSEQRVALLAALDNLPEEQRAAFILAEIEELSAPEIAQALDVNVNTVYSRLRAARQSVAQQLATFAPKESP